MTVQGVDHVASYTRCLCLHGRKLPESLSRPGPSVQRRRRSHLCSTHKLGWLLLLLRGGLHLCSRLNSSEHLLNCSLRLWRQRQLAALGSGSASRLGGSLSSRRGLGGGRRLAGGGCQLGKHVCCHGGLPGKVRGEGGLGRQGSGC